MKRKNIFWALRLLALAVVFIIPLPARPEASRLIIIDDDAAMLRSEVWRAGTYQMPWLRMSDPDGGLEIIYALRDPAVKVLGITCAMGCSSTQVCMDSVKKILELTGRTDVPLMRGADSPQDLGKPTDAARFIAATVMANPGQVEIIATAPLTNIATALRLEPRLAENWKALHFATGEFRGALGEYSDGVLLGKLIGYQDLNINADPAACRYVLEHGGRFPVYPNEIMDEAAISWRERAALKKIGTPLSTWVTDEIWPMTLVGTIGGLHGMALHGVIPLAIALDPELAEPPRELRIAMAHDKKAGYYFAISDDPQIPARPVYTRLRDPGALRKRLQERCR